MYAFAFSFVLFVRSWIERRSGMMIDCRVDGGRGWRHVDADLKSMRALTSSAGT